MSNALEMFKMHIWILCQCLKYFKILWTGRLPCQRPCHSPRGSQRARLAGKRSNVTRWLEIGRWVINILDWISVSTSERITECINSRVYSSFRSFVILSVFLWCESCDLYRDPRKTSVCYACWGLQIRYIIYEESFHWKLSTSIQYIYNTVA